MWLYGNGEDILTELDRREKTQQGLDEKDRELGELVHELFSTFVIASLYILIKKTQ